MAGLRRKFCVLGPLKWSVNQFQKAFVAKKGMVIAATESSDFIPLHLILKLKYILHNTKIIA